jgi:uncharacterized protein (DUF1697 family)
MQTLISLLRGVNMAGHNKIQMTELSTLYRKMGFKDVRSYIQSGNVIFSLDDKTDFQRVASQIEGAILKKFDDAIPVFIRTISEIKKVIIENPFFNEENFDPARMAVIFLYETPSGEQVEKVKNIDYPPDKFKIIGKEIFIYCPNGFGRTKLYTNFFENKMKVTGTARNWKTVKSILKIAEAGH